MEALIFSSFALILHYDRKLVLFLFLILLFFILTQLVILLFPIYPFHNLVILSLLQLCIIYMISKIDYSNETSLVLFLFACLTVVVGIGYFYLPFLNGITWLLNYESRLCLEFIAWVNFTIFKDACKNQPKQNMMFMAWVIIGYGDNLWDYLI